MKFKALLFVLVVGLLAVPAIAFAMSEAGERGKIEPEVSAGPIDLSGMTEAEALAELRTYESELSAAQIRFRVKDESFTLSPATVSLDIDEEAIVETALAVRRQEGVIDRFSSWITRSREYAPVQIPIELSIDEDRLDDVFDAWERGAIAVPPYEGNIVLSGGRLIPEYPRPGEGIDRTVARERAAEAILALTTEEVVLPTKFIEPELTAEQINEWIDEASRYIDGPVTLTGTDPDVEVTFTQEDLVSALRTEIKTRSPASFEVWFDAATLESLVEPVRELVEQPPRDAEVIVDEIQKVVTVIPGRNAVVLDTSQVLDAVTGAALSGRGTALLPYSEGEPPEISAEDIAEWGPLGLVSSFTTKHPCCAARVDNIHLFADIVDGAVVMPGKEFSLNSWVGERTLERGFKPAPTIIRGELEDTVGGGVSQFATTFYNTVFHGCYEDVSHKPHTYYFSRYPEVSEATINWPNLDLVFRNDSDAPIWIKTNYTNKSITVEFYGNNGGRTCERILGERRNFTSPKKEYVGDPEMEPGTEKRIDKGFGGWTNSVKRVITFPDGTTEEQNWSWSYRAQNDLYAVHPCMLPDAEEACPVQVPAVVGKTAEAAKADLLAAGFKVAEKKTPADNESQDGKVASRSPADKWLAPGSTITLNVYEWTAPPTTTTTTTAPPSE